MLRKENLEARMRALSDEAATALEGEEIDEERVLQMRTEMVNLESQLHVLEDLERMASREDEAAAVAEATQAARQRPTENQDSLLRSRETLNLEVDLHSARRWRDARNLGVDHETLIRSAAAGRVWQSELGEPVERTLNVGTASSGGNLVPTILAMELYQQLYAYPGVRAAGARVYTTAMGGTYHVATTGSDPSLPSTVAAAITAESGAISETARTFGRIAFSDYKVTDRIDLTDEFINDAQINLSAYIGSELGRMLARKSEFTFFEGSGSSQPQGYGRLANFKSGSADNSEVVRTESDDQATVDEVLSLVTKFDEDYDTPAAKYLMRRTSFDTISLKKGTDGHFLLPNAFQSMVGRRLRGYDVALSRWGVDRVETGDDTTTSNVGSYVMTFADFSRYYAIREVGTMTMAVNPYIRQANGEVVYFGSMRCDGRLFDRRAGRVLFTSATPNS